MQTPKQSQKVSSRQFLTFTLGAREDPADEETGIQANAVHTNGVHTNYGINLLSVQEIRGYTPATPFPNAPSHVKGAVNLRGSVIPILDLRIRFGVPDPQYTKFTVVIVVLIAGKTVGMVADSVSDVLDLPASQVLPPPDFGPRRHSDCVEGLVDVDGGLVLILDLHRMLVADGIIEIHEGALAGQEAA